MNSELYKIISKDNTDNFAAVLNNRSEIEILFEDQKLFVWRKGKWSIFDPDIFYDFLDTFLSKDAIDAILWTAYALSKIRHGTLILVGDINTQLVTKLKKGSVAGKHDLSQELIDQISNKSVVGLKNSGELIRILSSDGLTIVDTNGSIIDSGIITDTSTIKRKDVTGGGRTTAAIAASNFGKVIKISEDGPIELYYKEKRIYKFG